MSKSTNHIIPVPRPVFFQDWWLNSVAKGKWYRETFIYKSTINAEWIFFKKKKLGFQYLIHPFYTPYSGLYIDHRYLDIQKQCSAESKIINNLIKKLPKATLNEFKLLPTFQNWYPFYPLGYSESTRYTYHIPPAKEEVLKMNLKPSLRNILNNQYESAEIHDHLEDTELILLGRNHFKSKKILSFWDEGIFKNILSEGQSNGQLTSFGIYEGSKLTSAIVLLEDGEFVYNLFNFSSKSSGNNDMSFLLWKSVMYASSNNKTFDFEGSMIPGVEQFYRGFGGELIPYHQISKVNGMLPKLYLALK